MQKELESFSIFWSQHGLDVIDIDVVNDNLLVINSNNNSSSSSNNNNSNDIHVKEELEESQLSSRLTITATIHNSFIVISNSSGSTDKTTTALPYGKLFVDGHPYDTDENTPPNDNVTVSLDWCSQENQEARSFEEAMCVGQKRILWAIKLGYKKGFCFSDVFVRTTPKMNPRWIPEQRQGQRSERGGGRFWWVRPKLQWRTRLKSDFESRGNRVGMESA